MSVHRLGFVALVLTALASAAVQAQSVGPSATAGPSAGPSATVGASEPSAEPAEYKTTDYRSPVPATLQGARVVTPGEAKALYDGKTAVLIDVYPRPPKPPNLPAGTVWRDPKHASIAGTHWLPNVGYGVLAPAASEYLATRLATLSGGDKSRTLVFFCLKDCWMSWNAAKRALSLGYTSVVWFPEGTDGWQALGLPLAEVDPVP